jgi:hypothetical protein
LTDFVPFTETGKMDIHAATATITEADSSSHLTQYDAAAGREGSGVKGDPETTEYKCEAAGMAPGTESTQLQEAE